MSRFVIRHVRNGPPELRAAGAVTGRTVERRTDPDGNGEFYLARLDEPLKYRFGPSFDTGRCSAERLDRDQDGPLLWVTHVVFHAHTAGERPYFGMHSFAVDLAYVVDLSLLQDSVVDFAKITYAAVVEIDDANDAQPPPPIEAPATDHREPEPDPEPEPAAPLISLEDFLHDLHRMTSALAALAGDPHAGDIVEPEHIEAGHGPSETVPSYSLGADALSYHTVHPVDGWTSRSTTDPDELLYWVIDDIVRSLAWRWAQQAPSYAALSADDRAQMTLWMPYWHIMMHGLRPDWGRRTRQQFRILSQVNCAFPSAFASDAPRKRLRLNGSEPSDSQRYVQR